MDRALMIALIAAVLNAVLSTIIPCLLSGTGYKSGSIMTEVKLTFLVHRYVIIVSSVLTAVITYLAVLIEPGVSNNFPVQLKNFVTPKPVA